MVAIACTRDVRRMSETSGDASSVGMGTVSAENTHLGRRVLVVGQSLAQTRALALTVTLVRVRPVLLGRVDLVWCHD